MKKRKVMTMCISLALNMSIIPISPYDVGASAVETNEEMSAIPQGIILEKDNIDIVEGSTYDLTHEQGGDVIQKLEEGTIIISFTSTGKQAYQSLLSIGNSTTGNTNRHFHLYITDTGALGMELRNTDEIFKYTLNRPAALRGSYKGENVENTVAFKADKDSKEYKIFANGELLAALKQEDFKFIKDIDGVNNVQLGGTIRDGVVAYPFEGNISNVKIYNTPLSDEELEQFMKKKSFMLEIAQNQIILEYLRC